MISKDFLKTPLRLRCDRIPFEFPDRW
ncbi:unnamed protein product, partial [Allacma fusca]